MKPMNLISLRRGSALLITLAFLVIIAILVVGLAETMRLERSSSRTHLERTRAMDFAQMGVERAVGQLHSTTANTNINWVASPGRISFSSSGENTLTNTLDLYSGVGNTNLAGPLRPPDLNARLLSANGTTHLITDRTKDPTDPASGVVNLPLRWIYVRQNGEQDSTEPPDLTNKNNPIVGRFAYWADDESSKINYNIAWKRSGQPPAHPSAINLPSLPGMTASDADTIHAAITTDGYTNVSRFYNTPLDARHLGTNISELINANKFELTHYNHDPETTFFNEPRIVLTTQERYAPKDANGNLLKDATGAPYFLDILKTANSDPGILMTKVPGVYDCVDSAKLNKTLALLTSYLKRSDWPMTTPQGKSLQGKYYGGNPDRLTQLALNIIDYVRSKESSELLVDPLRGSGIPPNFTVGVAINTGAYMALTRTPLINELGVWMNAAGTEIKVKVELYLPLNYGMDSIYLPGAGANLHTLFINPNNAIIGSDIAILEQTIKDSECSPSATLTAGNYVTVTRTFSASAPIIPRPASFSLRVAFSRKQLVGRLDLVPLLDGILNAIECPVDGTTVLEADITSVEVDDPRVNKHRGNWKSRTSGNSFGVQNSIWTAGTSPAAVTPQQDTDANGKISAASLYMPYPRGDAKNPKGLVVSSGEMGYIHTGVESSATVGIPWRSLRLQPNNYPNTSMVPDWAFMDLFTVPVDMPPAAAGIFQPHHTANGGRINVNAQVQPFGTPSYFTNSMERIYPLKAVFEGVPKDAAGNIMSAVQAETLARNVYAHTLAIGGKAYGNTNVYDSPGEVVETAGVADGGEESEAIVRGVANLITSRGNVFSIYTIGQSLKQTPVGSLLVNGEQRLQAMVERYLDNTSNTVKFRTVYFRNLTP